MSSPAQLVPAEPSLQLRRGLESEPQNAQTGLCWGTGNLVFQDRVSVALAVLELFLDQASLELRFSCLCFPRTEIKRLVPPHPDGNFA